MLYPPDALASAPVINEPREQAVLAEEAKWANEANAERIRARLGIVFAIGLSALLSLGALGFGIWAFLRHGKEYKPEFPGGYLREDPRPDLSPGVIGSLWRFGTPGNADMAATLMDLADKGIIAMRPTTVHHDGILGIGAKDETSFELGLNPTTPAADGRPDRPAAAEPAVRRYRCRRPGDARRDQVVRQGPPAALHRQGQGVGRRVRGDRRLARAVRDIELVVAGRHVPPRGRRRRRRVLLGGVGRDGVAGVLRRALDHRARGDGRVHAAAQPPRQRAVRAVQGGPRLPARFRAASRGAAAVDRDVEPVPRARGGLRNRDRGHQPAARQDAGGRRRPGLPDDVLVGVRRRAAGTSPVSSLQGGFASASQIASSELSSSSGGGGGFSGGGGGGGGGGGFSAG